jgi:transcriptional regulator with XRE-family HTH domain
MRQSLQDQYANGRISAHAIDLHIGRRMRALRKAQGLNQVELGDRIGVSFQQVQKYETAKSRVSAAMLLTLARALRTDPGAFYDALETPEPRPAPRAALGLDCAA